MNSDISIVISGCIYTWTQLPSSLFCRAFQVHMQQDYTVLLSNKEARFGLIPVRWLILILDFTWPRVTWEESFTEALPRPGWPDRAFLGVVLIDFIYVGRPRLKVSSVMPWFGRPGLYKSRKTSEHRTCKYSLSLTSLDYGMTSCLDFPAILDSNLEFKANTPFPPFY